jgi:hypothetical protein
VAQLRYDKIRQVNVGWVVYRHGAYVGVAYVQPPNPPSQMSFSCHCQSIPPAMITLSTIPAFLVAPRVMST